MFAVFVACCSACVGVCVDKFMWLLCFMQCFFVWFCLVCVWFVVCVVFGVIVICGVCLSVVRVLFARLLCVLCLVLVLWSVFLHVVWWLAH